MRTYKPHSTKLWTDAALNDATAEHEEIETSVRKPSKKFNIPQTTLI